MIDILEAWPVPYDALAEAPAELVEEWLIRIQARRTVEYRDAKRRESEEKQAARRRR